jgi:soluble lytic murein transglycosylase
MKEVRRRKRRVTFLDSVTARSESGNRDYYGNGQAVVSPAGARFAMQVMPDTARDPGFGLRGANPNDPSDMNRLGREYRATMQQRYGGDLAKMWAAYNWGPGNLDEALKRHGNDWLRHAPQETQEYVARNLRAARGGR